MKTKLFISLLCVIFFIGCDQIDELINDKEKEEEQTEEKPTDEKPTANAGENKWTIGGTTYTNVSNSAVWNGGTGNWGLMGNGSTTPMNAFQIWFNTQTPPSGTYNIKNATSRKEDTDVWISTTVVDVAYRSANKGIVTVTNTNGVISASLSNITLRTDFFGVSGDSIIITGNLTYRP